MTIVEQIANNLVDPEKHTPYLKALIDILEERGEKGLREQLKQWMDEILEEDPDEESKEV